MAYAVRGSLRNYFKQSQIHQKSCDKHIFYLKLKRKIIVLQNIASGLNRIHIKGLIHRNLNIGNTVCFNSVICIAGMSSSKPVNYEELEVIEDNVCGVLSYMAPEILRGQTYVQASDIYSFGIIMYEIITELVPYYNIDCDEFLALNICEGLRPSIDTNRVPHLIFDLIKRCLDANPSNRPNAIVLSKIFHKWINELSAYIIVKKIKQN
jgi:serine/threonine protein kinase